MKLVAFAFSVLFFVTIGQNSYSKELSQGEVLRLENIEKFKEWREGIPDYEKRLYDRVKKINKRSVSLMRAVVFTGIIVTILVPIILYIMLKESIVGTNILGRYPLAGMARPPNDEQENQETDGQNMRGGNVGSLNVFGRIFEVSRGVLFSFKYKMFMGRLRGVERQQVAIDSNLEDVRGHLLRNLENYSNIAEAMREVESNVSNFQRIEEMTRSLGSELSEIRTEANDLVKDEKA